jgi:monovalent cation/hydrogen antiporter
VAQFRRARSVARRVPISGPVFVTIGGIVLGSFRGSRVSLDPELVLLIILEPLVYSAAVELPWQDLLVNARSISLFAIALVAMTIVTVVAMVHAMIPAITWPQAFRFGAIISPTDPVASTAVCTSRDLI